MHHCLGKKLTSSRVPRIIIIIIVGMRNSESEVIYNNIIIIKMWKIGPLF
jgi:hypothetical protein